MSEQWVFLHGWGSDASLWQPLCERLPGHHHFIELPGFGRASNELVALEVFLDQVSSQLPPRCVLVGWSLGGMLATQLAHRNPQKIQALITIASNAVFVARDDWPEAMAPATFAQFYRDFEADATATWTRFCALQALGDRKRKVVAQHLRQQTPPQPDQQAVWGQGLRWLEQLDNRGVLAELRIPQYHVFGAADALVPAAAADRLRGLLPSAAEVDVLPQTAHAPHLAEPEVIARKILNWLSPPLDKRRVARSFGEAAGTYDQYAHIQRRVAQDLREWCSASNKPVLDIGCGTGYMAELLAKTFADGELLLADLAQPMVQLAKQKLPAANGLVADAEALPLGEASLGGIVSSLAFQWCHDLRRVAREAYRVLQAGGELVFSTLGPDTLQELKKAWQNVDSYTHVNHFHAPDAVRKALEAAGFVQIQLQRYPLVAQYDALMPLLRELKGIGAHNINPGSRPGLTARRQLLQLEEAYERCRNADGKLPATYDVLLVRARKP
ncbi:MAG: malonyl-ACP O-methyltransferase BioC [Cellvibrionaceae bacterium]|nr:malonyl-ACP O-methyltransferase BioC [Cellvibrionaceae bacterium]